MDNNLIQKTIIDRTSKTMSVKSDNQIMQPSWIQIKIKP